MLKNFNARRLSSILPFPAICLKRFVVEAINLNRFLLEAREETETGSSALSLTVLVTRNDDKEISDYFPYNQFERDVYRKTEIENRTRELYRVCRSRVISR